MRTVETPFGKIPVTDEFVPKKEWERYLRCAKIHVQRQWERGETQTPLPLDSARAMPEFMPQRQITSEGYVALDA